MFLKNQKMKAVDLAVKKMELENLRMHELNAMHLREGQLLFPPDKNELIVLVRKLPQTSQAIKQEIEIRLNACTNDEIMDVLISLLKSENLSMRWAGMRILGKSKSLALRPLFIALTRDFDSGIFMQSSKHVLRDWRDSKQLNGYEYQVLYAMEHHMDNLQVAKFANTALISNYKLAHCN